MQQIIEGKIFEDICDVIVSNRIEESLNNVLDKKLPSKDEIKQTKEFAIYLFDKVCNILDINKNEIMK